MTEDEKLDRVLAHMDGLHTAVDSIKTRVDAMEEEHKRDRADAAEWRARSDAEARERADRERRDTEERERHDRARADAVAASVVQRDMSSATRKRLEEIERIAPQFVEAQVRADSAYQALGLGQAPGSLYGEDLRDYRIRLLTPLKKNSRTYASSDINHIGDEAAFRVIEDSIINDSIEASCAPPPVGAPLREQVIHADSGHVIRKFHGDPGVTWAPFMGGTTRIGRINAKR